MQLIYTFPEHEVKRYGNHGIIHARLSNMDSTLKPEIIIKTEELYKIEKPYCAWVKKVDPNTPEITITTQDSRNRPPVGRKMKFIDPAQTLEGILVTVQGSNVSNARVTLDLIYQINSIRANWLIVLLYLFRFLR